MSGIFRDRFRGFVYGLMALFILLALLNLCHRFFDHDEFEHIHSAWYAARGALPYRDFFQVHHPLLWFLLAPFVWIGGSALPSLFILRGVMLSFSLGSTLLVYRLARETSRSKELGRLAALLLLSTAAWVEKGLEVRPDVPMVFFGLFALLLLVRFFLDKKNKYLLFAGLLASLSFLFLQKSVFLLAGFGLIFIYLLLKGEMTVRQVLVFGLGFLLPLLGLVAYLMLTGSFRAYLVSNWLLHPHLESTFSPHHTILGLLAENSLTWLLILPSLVLVFIKGRNRSLRMLTFLALLLLLATLLIPRPFKQNFLLPLALLCIPAACGLKLLYFRFRWGDVQKIRLLSVIAFVPFLILTVMIFLSHRPQLQRIQYVLEHSTETDPVYDGDIKFNVFRPDLHYMWYGLKRGKEFDAYNRVTGSRYGDYDICRLIRQKRPKFISDFFLDIHACGLQNLYRPTPHKHLYIRND